MKQSNAAKSMYSPTKSRKASKEREKRKSQNAPSEKSEQNNNGDKNSPNKDATTRKYAGIGPDSIICYSQQTTIEHLSHEVCYGFAEDLSYRLRYVMNDALIKARLSGRNVITSSDIDASFESLKIEKVYGAPSHPNWMVLNDHNVLYLDDQVVNLIDLAEKNEQYQQAGDSVLVRKWLPEAKENHRLLRNYFETVCKAVLSSNRETRQLALRNLQSNCSIGPIAQWFYHFGYFLLSKDITYDCLTLSALQLIKALEENCVAPQIVSERQLSLLVRLILQRLLRSATTEEVLKPMCTVLSILCDRTALKDIVLLKTLQKFSEVKENFLLPILSIVNAIGFDALESIFLPHLEYFLSHAELNPRPDVDYMLLQIYHLICKLEINDTRIDKAFYNLYGDSLVQSWKPKQILGSHEKEESNWSSIKVQLIKTRRKIIYYSANKKDPSVDQMFESDTSRTVRGPVLVDLDYIDSHKFKSSFQKQSYLPENKPRSFFDKIVIKPKRTILRYTPQVKVEDIDEFFHGDILMSSEIGNSKIKESVVEIGKRTLLLPVLRNQCSRSQAMQKCTDHSLTHFNL